MRKIFLLAVFAIATFAVQAQEKVTLRLNLKKGDSYSQVMSMNTTTKMSMVGQEMTMEMPVEMEFRYKVKNVYQDSVEFEASFNRMKLSADVMGHKMVLDTDDPSKTTEEFKSLNKIVGKSFTIVTDKRWDVLRVSGLEQIHEAMLSDFSEEQKAMTQGMLEELISEKNFKKNFSQTSVVFPEEAVSVGYSWTTNSSESLNGMGLSYRTINKIKSIDKKAGRAVITSTSKINMEINEAQGFKITMGDGTKSDIDYVIDLKSGVFQSADGEMVILMDMKGNSQGQEISMNMQMNATIKLQTK